MKFHLQALRRFWYFVAERHEIFRRRVLQRRPPPWTEDRVLKTVYFTNVYRELDRGTRYMINELIEGRDDGDDITFFNIVAYRAFNVIGTHQILAGTLGTLHPPRITGWNLPVARKCLLAAKAAGAGIFTGAFLITGTGKWSGRGGKIGLVCENLTKIWRERENHVRALARAENLQEAHRHLTMLPGIGHFMAYELVCDFMYRNSRDQALLRRFTEDDWVNIGPGAYRGLTILLGHRPSKTEGLTAIWDLRGHQMKHAGPELTLRNIEHSLCEFQKYERSRTGGRTKRTYDATSAWKPRENEYAPWDPVMAQKIFY